MCSSSASSGGFVCSSTLGPVQSWSRRQFSGINSPQVPTCPTETPGRVLRLSPAPTVADPLPAAEGVSSKDTLFTKSTIYCWCWSSVVHRKGLLLFYADTVLAQWLGSSETIWLNNGASERTMPHVPCKIDVGSRGQNQSISALCSMRLSLKRLLVEFQRAVGYRIQHASRGPSCQGRALQSSKLRSRKYNLFCC